MAVKDEIVHKVNSFASNQHIESTNRVSPKRNETALDILLGPEEDSEVVSDSSCETYLSEKAVSREITMVEK